jgi:hypothetical protein
MYVEVAPAPPDPNAPNVVPPAGFLWIDSDADVILPPGPQGPQGLPGQWTQITRADFDALNPPDPSILYVIIG